MSVGDRSRFPLQFFPSRLSIEHVWHSSFFDICHVRAVDLASVARVCCSAPQCGRIVFSFLLFVVRPADYIASGLLQKRKWWNCSGSFSLKTSLLGYRLACFVFCCFWVVSVVSGNGGAAPAQACSPASPFGRFFFSLRLFAVSFFFFCSGPVLNADGNDKAIRVLLFFPPFCQRCRSAPCASVVARQDIRCDWRNSEELVHAAGGDSCTRALVRAGLSVVQVN